jgi:hypothetical protein
MTMPAEPSDASAEADEVWQRLGEQAQALLLATPLGELSDRRAVHRALGVALDAAASFVGPLAVAVSKAAAAELSRRPERPIDLLGPAAADALAAVAARPDVVSEPLVRAVLQHPAVEAVLRDILHEALDEFSRKVNPFFADWGLPALVASLPLLAQAALGKAVSGLRKEYDKRLEPEMLKFLDRFARAALDRAIRQALDRGEAPERVALRQQVLHAVLEQPLAELCWSPAEERSRLALRALALAIGALMSHPTVRARAHELCDELYERLGATPLGELCANAGITPPSPASFVAAVRPALARLLASAPLRDELARLVEAAGGRSP